MPNLLTIIAPRHPGRGAGIAEELTAMGLSVARRSIHQAITPDTDIYIADTIGELGLFFSSCSTVFMGKSLTGQGGQNPIEPALLFCTLIFGPHMGNFKDSAEALIAGQGAVQVNDEFELKDALTLLIPDTPNHINMANAAHAVAVSQSHVLDRVMDQLSPYLSDSKKEVGHASS